MQHFPYRVLVRGLIPALIIALLVALAASVGAAPLSQATCAVMSLDPLATTAQPGQIFTVAVKLSSPSVPLVGADFDLRYDPTVLQVVTAGGVDATQIDQGNFGGIAPVNSVDKTLGKVRYAEVRTSGEVTGDFTLATVRFKAIGAPGTQSALSFFSAAAANGATPGNLLCAAPTTGSVTIPIPPTHTPTATATSGPTATATPTTGPSPTPLACPDLVQNGSFENNAAWVHPITPAQGNYTTETALTGARSMRLGIVPPKPDTYAYSTAYQQLSIPANVTQARLVFWYKPYTEEAPWSAKAEEDWSWYNPADVIEGRLNSREDANKVSAPDWAYTRDWQEALILDANYRVKDVVFRSLSNSGEWTRVEYDLTRFKNQTINIYFNALNNGTGGRRTWMFVDDVAMFACVGPVPPTATPVPTATPAPGCSELILNGGFEANAYWQHPITPFRGNYTTAEAYQGLQSMRLGVPPPNRDVYSHSTAYQSIVIPANADSARMTFWFKPLTEEPTALKVGADWKDYQPARILAGKADALPGKTMAEDYQETLILNRYYNPVQTVFRTRSNFGQWAQMTVDLTQYRGRRIAPYFNAFNTGDGQRTWMFVDSVSVEACWFGPAASAGQVSGQVTLQGQRSYGNTLVGIDQLPCAETGPTGDFQCELAPDEPTTARLTAEHPGYLRAEKPIDAAVVENANTELVAGDANNDGSIDLFDLVIVAANYDTTPLGDPRGDINSDGAIDILDLVLAASNYGAQSPTSWGTTSAKSASAATPAGVSIALRGVGKGKPGSIVWAEVSVQGRDVYGVDVALSFDALQLAPVGGSGEVGKFLDGAHIARNVVDGKSGTARFAATLVNPAPAASGSGVVYRIPFRYLPGPDAKRAPTITLDKASVVQKGGESLKVNVK